MNYRRPLLPHCRTAPSLLVLLLSLTSLAATPAQQERDKAVAGLKQLADGNLRLTSTDQSHSPDFHFTARLGLLTRDGQLRELDALVVRHAAKDRVAILVRSREGWPFAFITNGLYVAADREDPRRLVLHEGGHPRFVLENDAAQRSLRFQVTYSPTPPAQVTLDLSSIVHSMLPAAQGGSFDMGQRTIGIEANTGGLKAVLPMAGAASNFPLQEFALRSARGMTLGIGEVGTDHRSVLNLLAADAAAVKKLGLPIRPLADADVAKLSPFPPPGYGRSTAERETATKLMELFAVDQEVVQRRLVGEFNRRFDLVRRGVNAAEEMHRILRQVQDDVLHPIQLGMTDEQVRRFIAAGRETRQRMLADAAEQPYQGHYDRARALAAMEAYVGRQEIPGLFLQLLEVINDRTREPQVRFLALELLGDVGLPDARQTLTNLERDFATDPTQLPAVLPSIRARVTRNVSPEQLKTLTDQLANKATFGSVRIRALEALALLDKLPDDAAPALETLANNPREVASPLTGLLGRYLYVYAANPKGRATLLSGKTDPMIRSNVLRALANVHPAAGDDAPRILELFKSVASNPASPDDEVSAVLPVVAKAPFADDVLRQRLASPEPRVAQFGYQLIRLRRSVLAYIPQLEQAIASREPLVRVWAVQAVTAGIEKGADASPVVPILKKALADEHQAVRNAALGALAYLKREDALKGQPLLAEVYAVTQSARDPAETMSALFTLEVLSDATFRIDGDPRTDGWPAGNAEAAQWWAGNAARIRASAKAWAENPGVGRP